MTDDLTAAICRTLRNRLIVPDGQEHVGLDWDQIEFLLDLLRSRTPRERKIDTLEIGLGIGRSATAFLASGRPRRHTAINFDTPDRQALALSNVRMFDEEGVFELVDESSQLALPKLVAHGAKFDVVLIDGGHRFEEVFIDFHYVRSLINPGGFVLFDDLWMPSTKTVVSWLEANLDFEWDRVSNAPRNFAVFQKRDVADSRVWFHFVPFATSWPAAEERKISRSHRRLDRAVAAACRFFLRSYLRIRPKSGLDAG